MLFLHESIILSSIFRIVSYIRNDEENDLMGWKVEPRPGYWYPESYS